ncbi:hypothetical protein CBS101457_002703 [Exobasidium rhododendri]|nr:hypothetical protein CBS101457_002703 [Exobasidium rhododendri]
MSKAHELDAPKHTLETLRPLLIKLTLSCSIPIPVTDAHQNSSTIPTPPIKATGPPLSLQELHTLFEHLADSVFTSNTAHHAQIGACLTSLRMSGWDMSSQALTIASEIFLEKALPVQIPELQTKGIITSTETGDERKDDEAEQVDVYDGSLDLVGTGGDGHDTFNVSTTAAIVAAGVPGIRVCKHGARASSSTSGSADLLAALDITLSNLTPSTLPSILPHSPFTFLFAQLYHPTLAPLALIRRSLGFPTIFNVLGPLINPSRPKRCIIGVHSWGLGRTFAEALRERKCERAWVVCGREGLDEISVDGWTDVWELKDGNIEHFVVRPASFALRWYPLAHVKSGTSAQNAAIARYFFRTETYEEEGGIPDGPTSSPITFTSGSPPVSYTIPAGTHLDAIYTFVLIQTSALLYVAGRAPTLGACTELARKSLRLGGAKHALEVLRKEASKAGAMLEREQKEKEERELRKIDKKDDFYYSKDLRATRP